jgi:hypothetical protein
MRRAIAFPSETPLGLDPGVDTVRIKKTRQNKNLELSVLIQSEPAMLWFNSQPIVTGAME